MEGIKRHPIKNAFCLVSDQDMQAEFDTGLQALKLNLPSKYFYGVEADGLITQPMKADFGAFLNYDFHYEKSTDNRNFGALPELGIFKDNWILRNNAGYRNNKSLDCEIEDFVRLDGSVEIGCAESATK